MNFKALITTLVLGSSSAAMADTSFQVSGSVTFGSAPTHVHVPARPIPAPTPVVVADDCVDPYSHVVKQPVQMGVWRGPYFNPTNTTIGVSKSIYTGSIATSKPLYRRTAYGRGMWMHPTTWFDLTEATRIDSGREQFNVGAEHGQFKSLKLQGLGGGSSQISHISIEYVDGGKSNQKVLVNRSLTASAPITIDLDGSYRKIARIIVNGSTDRGSAYKILAM